MRGLFGFEQQWRDEQTVGTLEARQPAAQELVDQRVQKGFEPVFLSGLCKNDRPQLCPVESAVCAEYFIAKVLGNGSEGWRARLNNLPCKHVGIDELYAFGCEEISCSTLAAANATCESDYHESNPLLTLIKLAPVCLQTPRSRA